jgi:DNA repair protein RadD
MIVPREFQAKMLDEAREALFDHQAIILRAATGAGKTVMGTLIGQGAAAKGRRVMFTVHRDFLVDQTSDTFMRADLTHGIIAAGYSPNPRATVQVASIDTLKNRLEKVQRPDLLVVDEAHHSVAAGWMKVISTWMAQGTRVIGLTATPVRRDGRGLAEAGYTHMVHGPSVRWLIENGYLCDYDAYAPNVPDMSGVETTMGDYNKAQAAALLDKPAITGDAIAHYQRLTPGKRAVAFCISVEHSQHVCAQFNASGIPAAHIDSMTEKTERKRLLSLFRKGVILVLTSVDIFGEGFDLPAIETAILLRPTQSLSLHLQQVGRALRTFEGKAKATILDHAGNLMRPGLGLPDGDFEWTLEGRPKGKRRASDIGIPTRQCESCYAVFPPAPACPVCGAPVAHGGRSIEEVEGELRRIDRETALAAKAAEKAAAALAREAAKRAAAEESVIKKREVGKAKTLDDLKALEAARGYKPGWADNVWLSRERGGAARAAAQAAAYLRR